MPTKRITQLSILLILTFLFLPVFAYAQAIPLGNLQNLLNSIYETIKSLALPVNIIILAILGFQLISAGDDANTKGKLEIQQLH